MDPGPGKKHYDGRMPGFLVATSLECSRDEEFIRAISTSAPSGKSPPGRSETGRCPESQVQPELSGGADSAGLGLGLERRRGVRAGWAWAGQAGLEGRGETRRRGAGALSPARRYRQGRTSGEV